MRTTKIAMVSEVFPCLFFWMTGKKENIRKSLQYFEVFLLICKKWFCYVHFAISRKKKVILQLNSNCIPDDNYMFKVNNKNTKTRCEICSKLTIKTSEWGHWCCSDLINNNFEHTSHLLLVFLLLTLSR